MKRKRYTLAKNLNGDDYQSLLDYCTEKGMFFQFVIHSACTLLPRGQELLSKLMPFQVEKTVTSEWPGTKLHGGAVTLWRYSLSRQSMEVVTEETDSVYGWAHPELPEDLSLLREDKSVWLATISHEKDAYFELSALELQDLLNRLPQLRDALIEDVQ